jgi:broad specificity phosphatase PhoE
LIFIRHGVTSWNQQKKYCGALDVPLSPQGRRQARRLQAKFKNGNISRVYSSDRKRAMQTAKIAFKNVKIEPFTKLREIHFGLFEGLTHAEILKKYNNLYRQWLKDPFSISPPGGEDMKKFKQRILGAFKHILKNNPNANVAVVCHGGVIGILCSSIKRSKDFWRYIPASASISVIEHGHGRLKLVSFNERGHLNG